MFPMDRPYKKSQKIMTNLTYNQPISPNSVSPFRTSTIAQAVLWDRRLTKLNQINLS